MDSIRLQLTRVATGIVLVALGIQAFHHAAAVWRLSRCLYDTSVPECSVVERALNLAQGNPLYGNTRQWPYLAAPYGPLTYYPTAMAARAVGLEGDRRDQAVLIYRIGRGISLVAFVAVLAMLWSLARWIGLPAAWSVLPVALLFSSTKMIELAYSYRPDFPAIALSLAGWTIALRRRGPTAASLAALLLVGAVFTKQTALISALALGGWLLIDRRQRDGFVFAAVFALLTAAVGLAMQTATHGAWLENTVTALRSPLYLPAMTEFLFMMSPLELIPLAGGFAACLAVFGPPERTRPARWAFVFLFLGAEAAVSRTGSNHYYYIEPYCWGTLLAALLARSCVAASARAAEGARPAWIALLCLLVVPYARLAAGLAFDVPAQFAPPSRWEKDSRDFATLLENTHGEILSVDGYASFLTTSPPTLMDPFLYSVRVASGSLSAAELVGKIARRDFCLIVLVWPVEQPPPFYQRVPVLPLDALRAIGRYYRLSDRLHDRYFLYRPAPPPPPRADLAE